MQPSIATAGSAAKADWARGLGAIHAFDTSALSRRQIIEGVVRLSEGKGADVVLDTVGGETFADSLQAIAYGGRLVALANVALEPSTIDTRDFYPKNVRILGFQITGLMEHGYDPRADLAELLAALATNRSPFRSRTRSRCRARPTRMPISSSAPTAARFCSPSTDQTVTPT